MKERRQNHNLRWNQSIWDKVIVPQSRGYESVAVYLEILALEDALRKHVDNEAIKALIHKIKNEKK